MDSPSLKKSLYDKCLSQLDEQVNALKSNLASIVESRDNETKSSVGDKYETGRAMMQLEFQKVEGQLNRLQNQKGQLKQIDPSVSSSQIRQGSLVFTNQGTYFISIPLGKVKLEEVTYFCLSLDSPIGKLLNKRSKGEGIVFNGRSIEILDVV